MTKKKNLKSIVESILFIKGGTVEAGYLAKIIGVKKKEILQIFEELSEKYGNDEESGLILLKNGNSARLVSNPDNAAYVERVIKKDLQKPLTKTALEVLAIIAYRGPIGRSDIDAIRGVNSAFILRNLLIRGLVTKKKSKKQRGFIYEISFEFLQKMGIKNIKELPDYEKLSRDERVESIVNIYSENK